MDGVSVGNGNQDLIMSRDESDTPVSHETLANGDVMRLRTHHQPINGLARSKSLLVSSVNGAVRSESLQARITNYDSRIERSQARYLDGSSGGTNGQTDAVSVGNGNQCLSIGQDESDTQPYTMFDDDDSQYTFGGIPIGVTTGLGTIKHKRSSSKHSRKYEDEGVYSEVYDEIDDIEPHTPSTPSKNRCYVIALASIIVTVLLAGATFAVVYFLRIKSMEPPVDFKEPDYTFNIGEPGKLTFKMVNPTDWTELYISMEYRVPVASVNKTSPNVVIAKTHEHISVLNTTELSNQSLRVDLLFNPVLCSDAGGKSGIVTYVFSIKRTDSTWSNVTRRIRFQRLPVVPQLHMSREVINHKATRRDLPYICEGEVGDPPGQLIIESDFDGDFQALLTVDNRNNSVGYIVYDRLSSDHCWNYQMLHFAFHKANMSMNFKRLRCSIKPSSEVLNSDVKSSDEGIIKVVPDDWCTHATINTPIIDHPYACHLGVMCSADGIVLGVPESDCSEDQCLRTLNSPYGCYSCYCSKGESIKPPVGFKETDYTFNIGEPDYLTFEIVNLTDWTELYISREFTVSVATASKTSPNLEIAKTHGHISALNTTELSYHSVRVDLLFSPVLCSDADGKTGIVTYVCSIKMTDSTWSNVTQRIRFQRLPGVPKLTMSREVINNKVTRADLPYVCAGELGDPRGQMIIESDFDGEFQALLTLDNRNNSVGFIFDDKLTNGSCGNYKNLSFAFPKASMSMNFKRLRCSIKPSSETLNSDVKSSVEGIIKVVPYDWCYGRPKSRIPIIDHPYACHLGVMCSEVGVVLSVLLVCNEDECFNNLYECYPCNCTKGGPVPTVKSSAPPRYLLLVLYAHIQLYLSVSYLISYC